MLSGLTTSGNSAVVTRRDVMTFDSHLESIRNSLEIMSGTTAMLLFMCLNFWTQVLFGVSFVILYHHLMIDDTIRLTHAGMRQVASLVSKIKVPRLSNSETTNEEPHEE